MTEELVKAFLGNPFPLWELSATDALVYEKWQALKELNIDKQNYGISKFIEESENDFEPQKSLLVKTGDDEINIELVGENKAANDFYLTQGLDISTEEELENNQAPEKLLSAFEKIGQIEPSLQCVRKLVRSVHLLNQVNPEIDTSYTHPKIPFSIFLSVCPDNSPISRLRVAESILHEAMHLKLTLIENRIPLLKADSGNLYFSPWRDEKRPAGGVLHGLFVFRAIYEFYEEIGKNKLRSDEVEYLEFRNQQIKAEINQIQDFYLCHDLTEVGSILTRSLLPWS
jgi:HEXXH motif-containing protein